MADFIDTIEIEYKGSNAVRIDKFVQEELSDYSRTEIQDWIKNGFLAINSAILSKASVKISPGDIITVNIPEPVDVDIKPENIPLDILYEDSDIIIVNKPKGMVVHPAPGNYSGTLVNALMYHCKDLSGINGKLRPGIVHRIDKDTTGSLIVCKNDNAHSSISRQLEEHTINRIYHGIVCGNISDDEGMIIKPIGRDKKDRKRMAVDPSGKNAITHYKVIKRFGDYTYVEFKLETGRTHQIRVHMASINHPLLGDQVYGPKKCPYKLQGQTLHAKTIGFIHPTTGNYMEFEAPLPEYFDKLLKIL